MWEASVQDLAGRGRRYGLRRGGAAATFAQVLNGWRGDVGFRGYFGGLLADAPYSAYRWETPPLTAATVGRPFEFVLLDEPPLARPPDRNAFREHFTGAGASRVVAAFANLGNDAVLVVPREDGPPEAYVHLASFVRGAPQPQQHELWETVAGAVESRLGDEPLWLSTAGAGVAWLHVRIDSRPKYYGHRPYRTYRA